MSLQTDQQGHLFLEYISPKRVAGSLGTQKSQYYFLMKPTELQPDFLPLEARSLFTYTQQKPMSFMGKTMLIYVISSTHYLGNYFPPSQLMSAMKHQDHKHDFKTIHYPPVDHCQVCDLAFTYSEFHLIISPISPFFNCPV